MKKAHLFYKTTISVVIAFLIIMAASSAGPDKRNFEISKNLEIFNALYKELNMFYVDTINSEKTISRGINSMLSSLDPYTNYIPESEQEDFRENTVVSGLLSLLETVRLIFQNHMKVCLHNWPD